MSYSIVGYVYEAAVHCEDCTAERFPDFEGVDNEGNEIGVYTDSDASDSEYSISCDDCGDIMHEVEPEPVAIRNAGPRDRDQIGIHLLNPTQNEIDDAIATAERDGFPTVWVHRYAKLRLIQGGAA